MNYFTKHSYCLNKRINFFEVLHCLTKCDRTRQSEHGGACIVGAHIHSVLRMDDFTLHIIFSATVAMIIIIAAVAYVSQYALHFEKQPMHTSSLSGEQWVVCHTMGMVTFEAWFMKKKKKSFMFFHYHQILKL
jgi:hypothetical protein